MASMHNSASWASLPANSPPLIAFRNSSNRKLNQPAWLASSQHERINFFFALFSDAGNMPIAVGFDRERIILHCDDTVLTFDHVVDSSDARCPRKIDTSNTGRKIQHCRKLVFSVISSGVDVVYRRRHRRSEEHTSELQSHVNVVCR